MPDGNPTHYLRINHQSRQPRRHIIFDTEAERTYDGREQTQSWQCGAARFMVTDPRRKPSTRDCDYTDPDSLWMDVSAFTRPDSRTFLWAHNLSYDLRISRALEILPRLGWSLRAIVLDGMACWARFTAPEGHTLICCDFTSWASVPLATIASYLQMGQEPLPQQPTHEEALTRCRRDVEILSAAVLETLRWIKTEDLGNVQITGSGQAFSAYRHKFMTEKILVHADPVARETERRAMWAGRTETFRHGKQTGPFWEYDMTAAYAHIARDCELPTVWLGSLKRISLQQFNEWTPTRRILADCTVKTSIPTVPCSADDRVIWPIGQFRSTLWDCEIQAILNRGGSVRLHRTHVYTRTPCLHDWAKWVLARLLPERGIELPDPPTRLQTRILKQWSRSLIGRFALQYRSWEPFGESDESDLFVSRICGPGHGPDAQLLQVGHDLMSLGEMQESDNSLPQITGWITSQCRVQLLELIETAGWDHVLYCDTDGLIVDHVGRDRLEQRIADETPIPLTPREGGGAYNLALKGMIHELELNGPRQLLADGERRYSGVPKQASQTAPDEVVGEVWEGLGESLRHGRPGKVIVHERAFRLEGVDHRREWLPDGSTRPVELQRGNLPANAPDRDGKRPSHLIGV